MTREERKQKLARVSVLLNGARAAGRDMTSAERTEVDGLLSEVELNDLRNRDDIHETRGAGTGGRTQDDEAFSHYLRTGDISAYLRFALTVLVSPLRLMTLVLRLAALVALPVISSLRVSGRIWKLP